MWLLTLMSSTFKIKVFPDNENMFVVLGLVRLHITFGFKSMSWQVLIANGIPSESDVPTSSAVEAPLTIGISNSQASTDNLKNPQYACLMQGMSVTIPLSIQRQPIPMAAATEVFDVNGAAGANAASQKRRKPWSKAEDLELMAAVEKCGEGNWANILKGDFKGDRTASQLSQVFFHTFFRCYSPPFF